MNNTKLNPEIQRVLDLRLINGEISDVEYTNLLEFLQKHNSSSVSARHKHIARPILYVLLWTGCLVLSALLAIIALVISFNSPYLTSDGEIAIVILIICSIFISLGGYAVFYTMLYKSWSAIQIYSPRTTPGKAVGFCFIPFFNLYWLFIAINGLVKDVNQIVRNQGRCDLEISAALGVLIPTLFCLNIIPWFNCLTSLVNIVLIPIYMYQVLNAINQLVIKSTS